MHKLFDTGYLTVTPDYRIEVRRRIKEEFENGLIYYPYHGRELLILPDSEVEKQGAGHTPRLLEEGVMVIISSTRNLHSTFYLYFAHQAYDKQALKNLLITQQLY